MLSHQTLKVVADSVNPILGILALTLPFKRWLGQWQSPSMNIAVTLLTVALMYFFRAVFDLEAVWANWGLDFSTHEAVCVILVIGLSSLYWRGLWIWCAVLVAYDILMVYQSYHTWADLDTTAVVMLPFATIIRYCGDRFSIYVLRSSPTQSR
jgi:hypothetical protein